MLSCLTHPNAIDIAQRVKMGEITTTITEQFTNLVPGKRTFLVRQEYPDQDAPPHVTLFEVDEKYEVIELLGSGTFGTVCMARDTSNNELVAIKKIGLIDGTYCSQALRELQVHREVTRIRHPFIVKLKGVMRPVDIDQFNDIYIVMEMVDWDLGGLLKSQSVEMEKNSPQVLRDTKLIMYQLLKGLQYLHNANVIHRDLKPGNILLEEDPLRVKLCDFGLARRTAAEMTNYVVTAPFRPPELFLKDDPDHSSFSNYTPAVDVWSLGCIFAELLCPNPLAISHLFDLYDYDISSIYQIVETIAPPSDDEMEDISDDEVVVNFLKTLPREPTRPLSKIFEKLQDKQALDLLQKMLVFNPAKRISIDEALQHDFLKGITLDVAVEELKLRHSEVKMLKNPPTISVDFNVEESEDKEENRKMLFDACVNFEI